MLVTLVDDSIPFNGMTPPYQALGGPEKAFASLPSALARQGHVVRAITRAPHSMGFEDVSWIHWDGRKPPITEVLIAFRKPSLLEYTRATSARILWVTRHAGYLDRPATQSMLERTEAKLVFLGAKHGETYEGSGESYRRNIAPGVRDEYRDAEDMDPANAPIAVVTTHPKQGLDWLLGLWTERIRPKVADAELHVYSAVLKKAEAGETVSDEIKPLYGKALAAAGQGVLLMAPGGDHDMVRAFRRSRVHLYPGSETEMYCSTLAESQAVGLPAVARPMGAIKERIIADQSGFLAEDDDTFVENAIRMLSDEEAFKKASDVARRQGRARSWDTAAREFETLFR
jgi:glycosyltransferase involved in cell wall biosynthesis